MSCGYGELFVLAFVLVVIFSASRMGALGNALGKFIYSFKKASKGQDFVDVKRSGRLPRPTDIEDATVIDEKKQG